MITEILGTYWAPQMNFLHHLGSCSFALICVLSVTGCYSGKDSSDHNIETQQKEIVQKSEDLNRRYLEGTLSRAKESLRDNAKLLEEGVVLEPVGRSQLLALTYFRLYALDQRIGDQTAADADLIRAQYWSLKNGDLTGVDVKTAIRNIKEFNEDRIIEYVDAIDKRHNGGRAPAYMSEVSKSEKQGKTSE